MRILITNDDGIHAAGLACLAEVAAGFGEVVVVAPAHEMSAVSHGLTLHSPLRVKRHGDERFSVDGTPADCVYLAVHRLLGFRPDVILSGINHGPNLGHDVHYSGTVAAAREACLQGLAGVAFSLFGDPSTLRSSSPSLRGSPLRVEDGAGRDVIHPGVARWVERVLRLLVDGGHLAGACCLNVNLPSHADDVIQGLRVTRLGRQIFAPQVERRLDPRGVDYYWIGSDRVSPPDEEGVDVAAVKAGFVSITPISTDTTDVIRLSRLAALTFDDPGAAS